MNKEKHIELNSYQYTQDKEDYRVILSYYIDDVLEVRDFDLEDVLEFMKDTHLIVNYNIPYVTFEEVYLDDIVHSTLHYDEILETKDFENFLNFVNK
jgi:transposase